MADIYVLGGANIDICGSGLEELKQFDSNPGTVEILYGGVGRNIAQILCLLKEKVNFVTCFSDDHFGRQLKADCEMLGMDCRLSKVVSGVPSSVYLAILDQNHDMHIAVSDMRILRTMDEEMMRHVCGVIQPDDMLVMDANLSMECIKTVMKHTSCRKAVDPVSTSKAARLKPFLSHIDIFKPNRFEAEELNGIEITGRESAARSLDWFLEQGVKEVMISMAEQGVLLGTAGEKVWIRHRAIHLENATGGGDSFMGAYVQQRFHNETPLYAAEYAISTAITTIENDAVRRRSLNTEHVKNAMKEMEFKEIRL